MIVTSFHFLVTFSPKILLPRNSKDLKTNNHKRPFLDMIINNRLQILNGRTLGDSQGDLTCIKPSGSSVVDYFIISSNLNYLVSHMKVKAFTMFSDHKPLELSLNLAANTLKEARPIHSTFSKAPPRYKITPTSKDDFLASMKNQAEKAQTILQSIYRHLQVKRA